MQRSQIPSWDGPARAASAAVPRGTVAGEGKSDEEAEAVVAEPAAKKVSKKRDPRPKLTPGILADKTGLPTVYKQFRKIPLRGRGHEADDLQLLLRHYETWAAGILPSFSFDDFVEKLEQSGGKGPVKEMMRKLRAVERKEYKFEHLFGLDDDEGFIDPNDDGIEVNDDEDPEYVEDVAHTERSPIRPRSPEPPAQISEEARQRAERNREMARQRLREVQRKAEEERAAAAAATASLGGEGSASEDAGLVSGKRLRRLMVDSDEDEDAAARSSGGRAQPSTSSPITSSLSGQSSASAPIAPPPKQSTGDEFDDEFFADESVLAAVDQLVANHR